MALSNAERQKRYRARVQYRADVVVPELRARVKALTREVTRLRRRVRQLTAAARGVHQGVTR